MSKTIPLQLQGNKEDSREAQQRADKILSGDLVPKEDSGFSIDEPVRVSKVLEKPPVETLSYSQVKEIYPIKISKKALEHGTDLINQAILGIGEGLEEFLKSNIVGLLDVMKDNKTNSIEDYINAVKFVTYKQAGDTNVRAYAKTFPDKIKRMEVENIPNSYLHSYAGSYSKSKMVVKIQAMMMIPSHIMYQDIFHQAIQTQASIMLDDSISPKVRSDAANSLMTHLKQPEIKQAELKIDTGSSGAISQLAEALNNLSGKQSQMLTSGNYSLKDIREATIIEVNEDEE